MDVLPQDLAHSICLLDVCLSLLPQIMVSSVFALSLILPQTTKLQLRVDGGPQLGWEVITDLFSSHHSEDTRDDAVSLTVGDLWESIVPQVWQNSARDNGRHNKKKTL
jgi:hypothetical protein